MKLSVSPLICLLSAAATTTTNAFVPLQRPSNHNKALLKSTVDDELNDLEKARANFEFLLNTEGLIKDNAILPLPHKPEEYTPRPLTESSRQRRELEMQMIASLVDSDEAVQELMSLWMLERGTDAAEELEKMETICSPGLVQEEALLRELLDEFGIHWAEPVSRLASLMYFKGNSAESEQWCEIGLAVKPWHFEIVHTHVMNALRNNDLAGAIRWQRKGLPSLNPDTNNKARKAWVAQALKDAQESTDKAEMAAIAQKQQGRPSYVKETEAWQ